MILLIIVDSTSEHVLTLRIYGIAELHQITPVGVKGVSYVSRVNKFRAYYTIGGKQIHLGYFDTLLEAKLRRQEEAKKVYGEFAFEDEKYEII
jgi:hypothetical protein